MNKLPSLLQVTDALQSIASLADASEAHGLICAFYCVNSTMDAKRILEELCLSSDAKTKPKGEHLATLKRLVKISAQQLADTEYGFELLLPDDEEALSARSIALGHWCEGFLCGLGLAGKKQFNADQNEALDDLRQIVLVDKKVVADEESEVAYTELVEYVRMVVIENYWS